MSANDGYQFAYRVLFLMKRCESHLPISQHVISIWLLLRFDVFYWKILQRFNCWRTHFRDITFIFLVIIFGNTRLLYNDMGSEHNNFAMINRTTSTDRGMMETNLI